ncbi:MAG: Mut7-C RNAse domain-containing protein [Planctomycetota bacterium]
MSRAEAVACSRCGRTYAPERFESGRVIDCACGAKVGGAPITRRLPTGPETRLFADAMLGRLARWLRVVGVDTAYEPHIADGDLVQRSLAERRAIVTRDRRLPSEWRVSGVIVLETDDVHEQLQSIIDRFDLWTHLRPFTRCTRCNTPLQPLGVRDASARVPPAVLERTTRFTRCPRCDQVYWHGSHTDRAMRALQRLRGERTPAGRG